jgi:hypothetical protein
MSPTTCVTLLAGGFLVRIQAEEPNFKSNHLPAATSAPPDPPTLEGPLRSTNRKNRPVFFAFVQQWSRDSGAVDLFLPFADHAPHTWSSRVGASAGLARRSEFRGTIFFSVAVCERMPVPDSFHRALGSDREAPSTGRRELRARTSRRLRSHKRPSSIRQPTMRPRTSVGGDRSSRPVTRRDRFQPHPAGPANTPPATPYIPVTRIAPI